MDEFNYLIKNITAIKPAFDYKKNNPKNIPNLIITYGPPASGKSIYLKKLIGSGNNYVKIIVDDVVESFDEYKNEIQIIKEKLKTDKIVQQVISDKSLLKNDQVINHLNNIAKESPYMKYRSYANKINNTILNICLEYELDIIFETTGGTSSSVDWLLTNIILNAKNRGYKITIIYPYVNDVLDLQQVAIKRAVEIGRLPNLEIIKDIYENAQSNIRKLIDSTYVDEIFIYKQVYSNDLIKLFSKEIKIDIKCNENLKDLNLNKHIGNYCKYPIKYNT